MERCHYCRDPVSPNLGLKGSKHFTCDRCTELLKAPPCQACGKPVRTACRNDPEPYHAQCRRCKSCYQVVAKGDVVKLAGQLLCSTCDHLFGKFFVPKRRAHAERMKEAFEAWDCDGSGSIEIGELRRVLKALDPDFADRDLSKLFGMIDANRDGVINYEEFCQWIMKGTPIDIQDDGFEAFVAGLMRAAGTAAQQADMEVMEVQLRPDGLLFVRRCGEESLVTRALRGDSVQLTRLDPEEFICQVECTEQGLILTMNTGRLAVVGGQGRLFGPWQAPEGFHITGLRTKPADVTDKLRGEAASSILGSKIDDEVADSMLDTGSRSKPPTSPESKTVPVLRTDSIVCSDAVVGVELAPLHAAKSYDAPAALRFAAEHDFLYTLQRILAKAAVDVNGFGPGGVTALMLAAQHGNVGSVRLLLGSKASPSVTDPEGWTALTFASMCGQTTVVNTLLERGGATQEGDGGAALREALRHQHNSAARALLRAGLLPLPKGTFALEDTLDVSRCKLGCPIMKPAGSVFSQPVTVELTAAPEVEPGAEDEPEAGGARATGKPPLRILYTLDGRDPYAVGGRYRGPITLTAPRTHLRAVAVKGCKRSTVADAVYAVCHYAMPDDVVSGVLTLRAFPEAAGTVGEALAVTLGEPQERVRVRGTDVEAGSGRGWWLRVPLRDPRPRHCLFIDRSFATVRGNKLKGFTDNFRADIQQAVGMLPEDVDVQADLRAGRSAHKAGSVAVEFTLPRELAEEVRQQLDDPASFMLSRSRNRAFFRDADLQVVQPLSERLVDRVLVHELREALGKRALVDEVIGFGTYQEGMVAVAVQRSEAKKLKERGFLTKAIMAALPNTELGEVLEGPDLLEVEYTVDVISGLREGDSAVDGVTVMQELNGPGFRDKLMFNLAQLHLPVQAEVNARATSRELSQVEFHLEWRFPTVGDSKVAVKKDFLDGICMIYCGPTLAQVVDFRSAHEDRQMHDGEDTHEAADLCRSIQRAIQHSGDILSEQGGEHRMSLDLDALPPTVTDLFFVLAAFDCNDLSLFPNPVVEIHDIVLGRELTNYGIEGAGHAQAVIMCSFTRDPDHGKWVVHGHGIPTEGNAKDYEPIKRTITMRCQTYSRWNSRECMVKIRTLHKCKRLTHSSNNELAKFLWRILDLPVSVFQLLMMWL